MQKNRGKKKLTELTTGPAKLTRAFGIDGRFNRRDLTRGNLIIAQGNRENFEIESTSRIGIKNGLDMKLRFYIKGNPFVSYKLR